MSLLQASERVFIRIDMEEKVITVIYNDFTLKECRIPMCMSVVAYDYGRFKCKCTRGKVLQQIRLSLAFFITLALRSKLLSLVSYRMW